MDFETFSSRLKRAFPSLIVCEEYYVSEGEKTKVICSKHGEYKVYPLDLLREGCPKCGTKCIHKEGKCTLCIGQPTCFSEFVILAKQINGNTYTYKHVKDDIIEICCKWHLPTRRTQEEILACKLCIWCPQEEKRRDFINRMIEKYGFIYDYSQVVYHNENTKVKLIGVNGEIVSPPKLLLKP